MADAVGEGSGRARVKSEKEKMLAGELYDPRDAQLSLERAQCRAVCKQLNDAREEDGDLRRRIVNQLLGYESDAWIQPPFFCDYGYNIALGSGAFFNFNCVILDVTHVTIGDNVLFGTAVQIYTASHPMEAALRRTGRELAKPVSIGSDAWVGGGVIICPSISIGERTVIGAESVVTRSIPDDVFAAGNPCRVIRSLAKI